MKASLERAIKIAGSQTALARLINKTQAHVWNWLQAGRVPGEHCIAIEQATGGQVTRYELRPDVFGDPPKKSRAA